MLLCLNATICVSVYLSLWSFIHTYRHTEPILEVLADLKIWIIFLTESQKSYHTFKIPDGPWYSLLKVLFTNLVACFWIHLFISFINNFIEILKIHYCANWFWNAFLDWTKLSFIKFNIILRREERGINKPKDNLFPLKIEKSWNWIQVKG